MVGTLIGRGGRTGCIYHFLPTTMILEFTPYQRCSCRNASVGKRIPPEVTLSKSCDAKPSEMHPCHLPRRPGTCYLVIYTFLVPRGPRNGESESTDYTRAQVVCSLKLKMQQYVVRSVVIELHVVVGPVERFMSR